MKQKPQSIDAQIRSRIYGHGRGWVFTPKHFHTLGTRVVRTLMDWGLIAKGDRTGIYSQAQPINVISPDMISLLAEAVLIASSEEDALAESTLGSPCLFPAKFVENPIPAIGLSTRLSLTKSDYGGYRLKRMPAAVG